MSQKNKVIVVFAPHPDDETFGCGGTIAKKISEGFNVLVVVMTDGRNLLKSILNIEDDPPPNDVKDIRRKEVLKATKILGIPHDNVIFFDFEDGCLSDYEAEAEEKVCEILSRYRPVEVYLPFENDGHRDHIVTNRIVKKCVKELNLEPEMYQYCIMHKFARFGPIFERIIGLFRKNIVKVDVSQFLKIKELAVKEFKSEFSIISSKQSKPLEDKIDKYLKKNEFFFR
ncbi:MAG: PIG-L family deacetylase [Candidatus Bathyarchaeia archaeon]